MTGVGDIPFDRTDGTVGTLAEHTGDVVLIVNVASKCGLTPQYEGLQALYLARRDAGFTILGFPANNFGGQEPGTDEEIAEFCSTQYAVTFPVLSKISVVGEDQHPLYAALTAQLPRAEGKEEFRERMRARGGTPTEDPDVLWNFEKFLIGRDGTIVGRFGPGVRPDDPSLVSAIEAALSR
jgi:glutathione peroxidase